MNFSNKIFGKHFKYVRLSLSFDMPSDMPKREVKRIVDDTKIKECDFLFFSFFFLDYKPSQDLVGKKYACTYPKVAMKIAK